MALCCHQPQASRLAARLGRGSLFHSLGLTTAEYQTPRDFHALAVFRLSKSVGCDTWPHADKFPIDRRPAPFFEVSQVIKRFRITREVMAILLVAIVQTMAPAHGQNKDAKAAPKARTLTSADFGACHAELEENFRLGVARIRERMAARAAMMERQRPNVSKWDQDKQDSDQRFLDTRLQQGPMEIFGNAREVDETRAEATKWIKGRELENSLLRRDPGGDQIRQIVGITFTQEEAVERIAFNLAFICVMNLRLAQLDGKPMLRAAPTAPGPSTADNRPVPTDDPKVVGGSYRP